MSGKINEFTFGIEDIVNKGVKAANDCYNSEPLEAFICIPDIKEYENLMNYFESKNIGLRMTEHMRQIMNTNLIKYSGYVIWFNDLRINIDDQTMDRCHEFTNYLNTIYNGSKSIITRIILPDNGEQSEFLDWYYRNIK